MKIAVISFDYWGYDEKIVDTMKNLGHEAIHVKLSIFSYRYKRKKEKITNFLSKIFLNKNIKKIKSEEFIIDKLVSYGKFDAVLTINPERISKKTHHKIKSFTNIYIAYLYDSLARHNAKHLLNGIFDKVFSFDLEDSKKFNLSFLPNFIHFSGSLEKTASSYQVFSISSIDERLPIYHKIISFFDKHKISHEIIFFDKSKPKNLPLTAKFTREKLSQDEIFHKINQANIVLDIIRPKQNGLSFRIFDALALEKKIITTNSSIKNYDFYNANNIFVIEEENVSIPDDFFTSAYEKLPENIYKKYTLENWINRILNE